jgi:hypothetical protein
MLFACEEADWVINRCTATSTPATMSGATPKNQLLRTLARGTAASYFRHYRCTKEGRRLQS